MPASFDKCYKEGGKIKTEKISTGRYRRVCIKDGKEYKGHIETKKQYQRKKKK